jgi:hypothetical protein
MLGRELAGLLPRAVTLPGRYSGWDSMISSSALSTTRRPTGILQQRKCRRVLAPIESEAAGRSVYALIRT